MNFTLQGYAAPVPSGATFLIPYFARQNSNACYVQQLDSRYCIETFEPFEIPEDLRTFPDAAKISRGHGDEGILAFVDENGVVLSGTALALAATLDGTKLKQSPFAQLDLLRFLGRTEQLSEAIQIASSFIAPRMRNAWAQAERKDIGRATDPRREREIDLDGYIHRLTDTLHHNTDAWKQHWLSAWARYPENETLIALGLEWSVKVPSTKRVFPVLKILLSRAENAAALELTKRRLMDHYPDHAWAKLLALTFKKIPRDDLIFDKALIHVSSKPFSPGTAAWTSMWWTLRRRLGPLPELLDLVPARIPHLRPYDHRSLGRVLYYYFKDRPSDDEAREVLVSWFPETIRRENTWATLYLRYFDQDRDNRDLWQLGKEWLQNADPHLRTWPQVLIALIRDADGDDVINSLATNFLRSSNAHADVWPHVLMEVLRNKGTDYGAKMLASEWLEQKSEHPLAPYIMKAIEAP